jgi:hypothetical protein
MSHLLKKKGQRKIDQGDETLRLVSKKPHLRLVSLLSLLSLLSKKALKAQKAQKAQLCFL